MSALMRRRRGVNHPCRLTVKRIAIVVAFIVYCTLNGWWASAVVGASVLAPLLLHGAEAGALRMPVRP